MRLDEAQWILQEVVDKPYRWLERWGIPVIREAIRTVERRKKADQQDRERAIRIEHKINRK